MKRAEFYSLMFIEGKSKAIKQSGWTDGDYNYYRNKWGNWFCIEPQTGASICEGETLKLARKVADERSDRLAAIKQMPKWKDMIDKFNSAVNEAQSAL